MSDLTEKLKTSAIDFNAHEDKLFACIEALEVAHETLGKFSKLMRHLDHAFLPETKAAQMQIDAQQLVQEGWCVYETVTKRALDNLKTLLPLKWLQINDLFNAGKQKFILAGDGNFFWGNLNGDHVYTFNWKPNVGEEFADTGGMKYQITDVSLPDTGLYRSGVKKL